MSARQPVPEAAAAALAAAHLGCPVGELEARRIPTGKFNDSFVVRGPAGARVVRIAPPEDLPFVFYEKGMMAQEPELHRLLKERTPVPVAAIELYDDSRRLFPRPYLVMELLPGRSLAEQAGRLDETARERAWRQVGGHLAAVHAVTGEAYGYLGPHRPAPPAASWGEAFPELWRRLILGTKDAGFYDDEEARALIKLQADNQAAFDRPVPAALCHMDVWAQNILVDESGAVTGLVDWDRALWGDPEIEYAVLDYCGVSTPAFWAGYGRPRPAGPEAALRHFFYYLYELQKYLIIYGARYGLPEQAAKVKQQIAWLLNRGSTSG